MAKYDRTPLGAEYSQAALNAELIKISTAISDALDRLGTGTNTLESDLDLNGYSLLNLPAPTTAGEPVRIIDGATGVKGATGDTGATGATGAAGADGVSPETPVAGTFNVTGAGAIAVTGVGFVPTNLILFSAVVSATQAIVCQSFVSSAKVGQCISEATDTTGWEGQVSAKAIRLVSPAALVLVEGDISLYQADGFTMNITTYTTPATVRYLAFG